MITLVDLEDCPELLDEPLRAAFGLTPAEARLARQIARGDSLEDIAERHQVSLGTVRVQLKSLFQKTQTHRQAQLVSLLARLGQLR
jgi:DNA-binding CsgD family transcriptional regulator